MMRFLRRFSAVLCAALALTGSAEAAGGSITIFSTNSISIGSRSLDYHPSLTISCKPGGDPAWSQSISLRESVSGSGSIALTVRLDGGGDQSEDWALGAGNRSFQLQGDESAKRLLKAKRLRVGWRRGFLSGRGEAIFDLAGARDKIAALVKDCGG